MGNTPTTKDFVTVTAGAFHAVAVKGDGTLIAWGQHGPLLDMPTPGVFTSASAGGHHTVALKDDGSVVR